MSCERASIRVLVRAFVIALVVALTVPLTADSAEAAVPDGFADETAFSGLSNPTVVRFSPDGRVFVAEKSGLIKVFDGLTDTSPDIFADLRTQVHNFWDRGLLGLALHPNFPSDPRVYVLYTYDAPPGENAPYWGQVGGTSDPCPSPPGATADGCVVQGHLSVLTAVAGQNTSDGTEDVLIEDWCQQYPSHSIGTVAFGPDGMLYASAGDGASFNFVDYGQDGSPTNPCGDPPAGVGGALTPPTAEGGALRSQDVLTMPADPADDPLTLDGTIIRIDPDTGAGLPDNPMAGTSTDPNASRVIAHGLRNPFRFAFRPGTDELWSGEVGWNTYEEINRIPDVNDAAMENFGWPCYEGPNTQSGYNGATLTLCEDLYAGAGQTAPLYAYHHNDQIVSENPCPTGGSSQAGVAFYQGGTYPAEYDGAMFAADYSRDCIWVMLAGTDGVPAPNNRQRFVTGALNPVHLEIGPGGDLFYVNYTGGTIQRLTYTSGNQPPTAVANATPTEGTAPLDVSFDATASTDPEGGALTFAWDLDGDGQFDDATGATAQRTYTDSGTVTASVQVTDPEGATDTDSVIITVNNTGPTASIDAPAAGVTWAVGDTIDFSGSATDAEDGTLPAGALDWSLILHHCDTPTSCHEHPIQDYEATASGSFVAPDHDFPSYLELRMTATDSGGLTDTASVELQPQTVQLTLDSAPVPLDLALNGDADTAPFTREVIVGSTNTITAAGSQVVGETSYAFSSWSDGGGASHDIVAPAADTTYTATYEASTGLVAAYGFEADGGTTVTDLSGQGNDGTVNGASWAVDGGYHGSGMSFDGSDDLVTVGDAASLDLRPTSTNGKRAVLVKEATSGPVYALHASGTGRRMTGTVATSGLVEALGPRLQSNGWQHLAVTYDGATVQLYVDGQPAGSQATSGLVTTSDGELRLGGSTLGTEYFKGTLDDVRIYNRALAIDDIQTDMATPVAGTPSGNQRPTAVADVDCDALSCDFDGSGSSDDGSIATYEWEFGDGATDTGAQTQHVYATDGTYDVHLTVTDDQGLSHTTHTAVVVSSSTAPIALTATGYKVKGVHHADLLWSGADGPVEVYRNNALVATVGGASHTDNTGQKGSGSYTYKVCEAGTSTCSDEVTVQF
jgi:PKD repeat protein/glucose/arabinose dehydrogenase